MGILSALFSNKKKKFLSKIDQAIDKVKHGTYNYIYIDLLEKYDSDMAGKLAAAVTNRLFNEKPVGVEAEAFFNNNKEHVEKEMLALKGNTTIGNMVADAIQIKASIIYNSQQSGSTDMNFGKAFETLKNVGFYKKKEDVAPPKLFLIKAEKYFSISLKKVKYL